MVTIYLTRNIRMPNGRIAYKGQSIQTGDDDIIEHIKTQLAAPKEESPIVKLPSQKTQDGGKK